MKPLARTLIRLLKAQVAQPLKQGVEVGVWRGETSENLLETFPELHLSLVDPYAASFVMKTAKITNDEARNEARNRTSRFAERVVRYYVHSVEAATLHRYNHADFVFIDANHDYEAVCEDLVSWWPVVRTGGVFCGHDYGNSGDRRNEYGVKRAVDEFSDRVKLAVQTEKNAIWWMIKP